MNGAAGMKGPDRPRCAPLADLFMDLDAADEHHTRRQMARLCYSCPVFAACEAEAHALALRMQRIPSATRADNGVTLGFRAGMSQRTRLLRLSLAAA